MYAVLIDSGKKETLITTLIYAFNCSLTLTILTEGLSLIAFIKCNNPVWAVLHNIIHSQLAEVMIKLNEYLSISHLWSRKLLTLPMYDLANTMYAYITDGKIFFISLLGYIIMYLYVPIRCDCIVSNTYDVYKKCILVKILIEKNQGV